MENICLFEHHFQKNNKQILNYEDELVEKVKYFKKLKDTLEIVKPCSKSAVRYMSETQSRQHAADVLNGQTVTQNGIVHTYTGFNNSMIECQKYTYLNEALFVATECTDTSCVNHTFGIHIVTETESLDSESFEDNATIIRSEIQKVHKVLVPEIIFLEDGTLKNHSCKNCSEFHKFHLRDDYFSKKMENNIHYISRDVNEDVNDLQDVAVIESNSVIYCKFCFNYISNELARPLNWRKFELLNEWFNCNS